MLLLYVLTARFLKHIITNILLFSKYIFNLFGAGRGTRTPNSLLRRQLLSPVELYPLLHNICILYDFFSNLSSHFLIFTTVNIF